MYISPRACSAIAGQPRELIDRARAPQTSKPLTDVRVTQGGKCLGLPLESLLQVLVRGDVLGKDLDGHGAIEPRVASLVHHSHAAGTQGGLDFTRSEADTWGDCHFAGHSTASNGWRGEVSHG